MSRLSDQEALRRLEALDPDVDGVRDGAPIRALSDAVDRRNADQREIETLVVKARQQGATWIEVGLALGVSPQAARQRYREATPRPIASSAPEPTPAQRLFEVYKSANGSYSWRLTADGRVLATSEPFMTKAAAVDSIRHLKELLADVPIESLISV